jgi:predicted RNA binding protein with dsRBD fold (UPF0201 family)
MNVRVRISAPVYPTEVEEKVKTAVMNIFPVELVLRDYGTPILYGEGDLESLRKLHLLLRESRILDTAREIFLKSIEGNTIQLTLNKQVAFVGKANFPADKESLGSINVEISTENREDLMKIIDWLAPVTADGRPIEEIDL